MKEEIMNTIQATNNTVENNNQTLNSFFTNEYFKWVHY